jgi:uncharacterized Ntn-hydrolase superfamily protein
MARHGTALLICLLCVWPESSRSLVQPSTFSIVARQPTQELGSPFSRGASVGTVVPGPGRCRSGRHPGQREGPLGPQALALLRRPHGAEVARARRTDSLLNSGSSGGRARGRAASWTGKKCMDYAGARPVLGSPSGNILAVRRGRGIAKAMRTTKGDGGRSSLRSSGAAGGQRGMQSAALLIVRPSTTHPEYKTRYVDLRVEDHKTPIRELRRVSPGLRGLPYGERAPTSRMPRHGRRLKGQQERSGRV